MSKELETIKSFQNKRTFDVTYEDGTQKHYETKTIGELFHNEIKKIEAKLQNAEKNKEVLDLMIRKGVNIVLLDYLHHINPDNAFETYNKEMRKAWCDLYELNREQFNMIVDYIEERKRK